MAKIPQAVIGQPLQGLTLLNRGKVRETYELPKHHDLLLVVASDRISIFDFVLNALVMMKGYILTAMNIFWREEVFQGLFEHDLVAYGVAIDEYLPEHLRGDSELQKRAVIVTRLLMMEVELIERGYLVGSGWTAYQETRSICGHKLPAGLREGDRLPWPIFTPTTKAAVGHDEHISYRSVIEKYGWEIVDRTRMVYELGHAYAAERGILLLDTKIEGSLEVIGDEVLTPDSSRFVSKKEWKALQIKGGGVPASLDKQLVRNWGKTVSIHDSKQYDPKKPEDEDRVHQIEVPEDVLLQTTNVYRYIFWALVGTKIEMYQASALGIDCAPRPMNLDIIFGSQTDFYKLQPQLQTIKEMNEDGVVRCHIVSCHRNPDELRQYAEQLKNVDVIVAGAGMSAQLPGMLKGWLDYYGKSNVPLIGVGFEGESEEANKAACSAIEQLPGQPVELDENGRAYFGAKGFLAACHAARDHEFVPKGNALKPAEFNMPCSFGSG